MKRFVCALLCVLLAASMAFADNDPIQFSDVTAKHGMAAAANGIASAVGVEIMKQGGNAVDAAVAIALALNVVEPNASGLGGGGFANIYLKKTGQIDCWDFREMAPASATKDMFASEQAKKEVWSEEGGKSIGVPGSVMGMFTILKKYGTMSFAQVAAPAIALCENGIVVDKLLATFIGEEFKKLTEYNPDGTKYTPSGLPLEAGAELKQPKLAEAFRILAKEGPNAFYKGEIGEAVVRAVNKAGGNMTMRDLANYKIEQRQPMSGTYRGYKIVALPPASSAGTHVIQILNIMENFPVKAWGHNSRKFIHHLAETSKMMFADRSRYMADTAFVKVPLEGLTSKAYAKKLASSIGATAAYKINHGDPEKYEGSAKVSYMPAGEHNNHQSTTHFSVIDHDGNMVAWTWTINYFFGSGVYVPEYGFMLNNEMDDFASNPASVNAPEPGKRPLSSMTPTLVFYPDGSPFMTLGSPGATRIILAVAQIIMNVIDFGMSMDEAIEAPRVFNPLSGGNAGKLMIEKGIEPSALDTLKFAGHDVDYRDKGLYFGGAQGIMIKDGKLIGGADSRRNGVAVGF